jgi:hypothetical protein
VPDFLGEVIGCLAHIGDNRAVPLLIQQLSCTNGWLQYRSMLALKQFLDRKAEEEIRLDELKLLCSLKCEHSHMHSVERPSRLFPVNSAKIREGARREFARRGLTCDWDTVEPFVPPFRQRQTTPAA